MADYLIAVLGLFDATLRAMFGVPVFAFFLACLLLLMALGLYLMLMRAARGKRERR